MRIQGIDASDDHPEEALEHVGMLWDTGAHRTIIAEDMFSDVFRQYLQDPIHDPYRSQDGVRVQMSAVIGFSNTAIEISAVILVVPKRVMPNGWAGIIFGQQQCIGRFSCHSIPRHVLNAKGEDVESGQWGDIVLEEFVDDTFISRHCHSIGPNPGTY
jgi:hypothetical protein